MQLYICHALKKLFSIFLTMIILSQVFVNVGLGVYYHLNKTYITQKLCENRSNPKLHCNGHCYLTKQLKKAEEGEKNHASNILKEKEEIISNDVKQLPGKYFPAYSATEFVSYASSVLISDFRNELVKPPAA